ncbi:MAG: hypothetical protein AAGA96_18615 [Verrucomicrobiota bacterium]
MLKFSEDRNSNSETRRHVRCHHRPGLDWLTSVTEVSQLQDEAHDALLVGPSDQGWVGEMLKPHVLTRVLNFGRFRCAGMVGADETPYGGHAVRNFGESALEMGGSRLQMIHFGSRSLALDLKEGYGLAASGEEQERFESLSVIADEDGLQTFVRRRTGLKGSSAYLLPPEGEFFGAQSNFHGIGLASPESLSPDAKEELLSVMKSADFVGVSDETGSVFLEEEGIDVVRMPCPLTVLPLACARQLRQHRDNEMLESIRDRFPNGWIAVEIGEVSVSDFDRLNSALREVSDREGLGLVFFSAQRRRVESIRRWVNAFPEWNAAGFDSTHIWEIASMLLHSRLYCGSSLDCRVICMSGGVARLNIPSGKPDALSYCELWEHDEVPIEFSCDEEWTVALDEALAVDHRILKEHTNSLHQEYFKALEQFCRHTGIIPKLLPEAVPTPHMRAAARLHHLQDEWLSDETSLRLFRQLNRHARRKSVAERIRVRLGLRKHVAR